MAAGSKNKSAQAGGGAGKLAKLALCLLLACALCVVAGCRDTDALKEVIYDQNSTEIDYKNPNKFYINDSQAETESQAVSSVEVSEEDPTSDQVQNLIIYSSSPNTEGFVAKQSKFSAYPDFPGIEASSTVFFYRSYDVDAIDHAVTAENIQDEPQTEDQEEQTSSPQGTALGDTSSTGTAVGTSTTGGTVVGSTEEDDNGGSVDGDEEVPGDYDPSSGFTGNEESGALVDPTIAYDVDDANKSAEDYPTSSFAAFGQCAVMVQMLGGSGALVATDYETLCGFAEAGIADAGSDPANGVLGNIAIGWTDSGTAKNLNAAAIIKAFQDKDPDGLANGTCYLLLDTTAAAYFGNYSSVYDELTAAGVQVSTLRAMDNTEDIKANVADVGTMLSASTIANYGANAAASDNSAARANYYISLHDDKVSAAAGGLARDLSGSEDSGSVFQTGDDYIGFGDKSTTTLFIDLWDTSAVFNSTGFDTGVAFSSIGYSSTPFSYYMQAGGAVNNAAAVASGTSTGELAVTQFTLSPLSPTSATLSVSDAVTLTRAPNVARCLLDSGQNRNGVGLGAGFGTNSFPVVIVKSSDIRTAMVESSASATSLYHPYDWVVSGNFGTAGAVMSGASLPYWSAIGAGDDVGSSAAMTADSPENPLGSSLTYDQILVNPNGIFCDWTEGTVESFLEAGWVSSQFGNGYDYSQWQQDVIDFYDWAYGVSVNMNTIINR